MLASQVRFSLAGADKDNFDTETLNVATKWRVHVGEASVTLPVINA
jgi:hypothetical protein